MAYEAGFLGGVQRSEKALEFYAKQRERERERCMLIDLSLLSVFQKAHYLERVQESSGRSVGVDAI
jgi:hypothetical protein